MWGQTRQSEWVKRVKSDDWLSVAVLVCARYLSFMFSQIKNEVFPPPPFSSLAPIRHGRPSDWPGQMIDNLLEIITWLDWYRRRNQEYLLAEPRPGGGDQRLVMYYDRGGTGSLWRNINIGRERNLSEQQGRARFNSTNNQMITIDIRITAKLITSIERKIKSMNSAAYNSEGITYHQISMYEYEFCTSTAINQNIDRINRISWKFITIFAIKLYCSSILMQDIEKKYLQVLNYSTTHMSHVGCVSVLVGGGQLIFFGFLSFSESSVSQTLSIKFCVKGCIFDLFISM